MDAATGLDYMRLLARYFFSVAHPCIDAGAGVGICVRCLALSVRRMKSRHVIQLLMMKGER